MVDEERRAAVHEAGHAVVRVLFGWRLAFVAIGHGGHLLDGVADLVDGPVGGVTVTAGQLPPARGAEDLRAGRVDNPAWDARREIAACLAGARAELHLLACAGVSEAEARARVVQSARSDLELEIVLTMLAIECGADRGDGQWWALFDAALTGPWWPAVTAVADRLQACGRLDGGEVTEIVAGLGLAPLGRA